MPSVTAGDDASTGAIAGDFAHAVRASPDHVGIAPAGGYAPQVVASERAQCPTLRCLTKMPSGISALPQRPARCALHEESPTPPRAGGPPASRCLDRPPSTGCWWA